MADIHIIIVDFGEKALIESCLKSIERSDLRGIKISVTVINNNKNNIGFAGGVNQGIVKILKRKWDYVFLLNNDIRLRKTSLQNLLKYADLPSVGLLGPRLAVNKLNSLSAGIIDKNRYSAGHKLVGSQHPLKNIRADFLSGAALLVKREVIKKVGLFDERFFLYYEDADYCIRARKKGYVCLYVPDSAVDHYGSASVTSKSKEYYLARNHMLFIEKHAPVKIKIREMARLPKTFYRHAKRYNKGGKESLQGLSDYIIRKFYENIRCCNR